MFTDVSCAMCRYILLIPILVAPVKAACLLVYAPSRREGYDAVNSRAAEIRNMKFSERSRGGWLWWGHATCQWPVTRREEARWRGQKLSACRVCLRRHSAEMTPNTIESGWSIENYIDVFMSRNLAEVWPELKSIVWAVSYVCLHPNEFKLLSQIRLDWTAMYIYIIYSFYSLYLH